MLHARWPALNMYALKHSFNMFLDILLIMDMSDVDWDVNSTCLVVLTWFLYNTVFNLVSDRESCWTACLVLLPVYRPGISAVVFSTLEVWHHIVCTVCLLYTDPTPFCKGCRLGQEGASDNWQCRSCMYAEMVWSKSLLTCVDVVCMDDGFVVGALWLHFTTWAPSLWMTSTLPGSDPHSSHHTCTFCSRFAIAPCCVIPMFLVFETLDLFVVCVWVGWLGSKSLFRLF